MSHALPAGPPPPTMTIDELRAVADHVVILDVRSEEEYAEGHVLGARNLPLDRLADTIPSLPRTARIVTVCTKGGGRSQGAAATLLAQGFRDVAFLDGGWLAWRARL